MTRSSAAKFAGCRRMDLEAEIKRDPAFRQLIQESELRPELKVLRTVLDAGGDPKQWRAAAWALERLYPRRYGASKREAVPPAALRKIIAQERKAEDLKKIVQKNRPAKAKRAEGKKKTGPRAKARSTRRDAGA